jgi:hypothetical protein
MLLSQVFYEYKENVGLLRNYIIKVENISNIHSLVLIENEENSIKLDIEENEGYVSVLFERKFDKSIYYALSDYSYIKESKDIFDVLNNSISKDVFYQEIRECIKNQKKAGKRYIYQIKLVGLIYGLIEEFLKM